MLNSLGQPALLLSVAAPTFPFHLSSFSNLKLDPDSVLNHSPED